MHLFIIRIVTLTMLIIPLASPLNAALYKPVSSKKFKIIFIAVQSAY